MQPQKIFIAGPCAIESVDSFVAFADVLVRLFESFPEYRLVYKGSFDKANRTLSGSPRGVGLVDAVVAWRKIRENHPGLLLTTDIHESWQAREVDVDVLQIPAFLGRQTPLLEAAASTGKIVNLKKPQWLGVDYFVEARTKTRGAAVVWATHRGSLALGGHLAVDLHELIDMRQQLPVETCFLDLTHTNDASAPRSVLFARAAGALGFENFFAEVHPNPTQAICDADHQLKVSTLETILRDLTC